MLNKEGNLYIIIFCVVMVLVTGIGLAAVSLATKDAQGNNIKLEKMQNILQAVDIQTERDSAEGVYNKNIKSGLIINHEGKVLSEKLEDAFSVDLARELKKDIAEQQFPIYVCEKEGKTIYIIPMRGKGLWDAIWGYVSVEGDMNTIYGATFDHKAETPGLGAEINQSAFQVQFKGKKITDPAGTFVSVSVIKPGLPKTDFNVDGISGGTLTSNGVHDMLAVFFKAFHQYALTQKSAISNEAVNLKTDSLVVDTLSVNKIDSTKNIK